MHVNDPRRDFARRARLEALRAPLRAQQAQISRAVRAELDEVGEADERPHVADLSDLGADARDEDTTLRLLEQGGGILQQIEWALARLEDGSYGDCDDCGEPIAIARLQALPFATTCVACQRSLEAQSRRPW